MAMKGSFLDAAKVAVLASAGWTVAAAHQFHINFDVLVAHNAVAMRMATRGIGKRFPKVAGAIEHILGLDRPYYAGPAQMGKPGTFLGGVICAVSLPICPVVTFVPITGASVAINAALHRWPLLISLFEGEFRRRGANHMKAVRRGELHRADVESRAVAGPDAVPSPRTSPAIRTPRCSECRSHGSPQVGSAGKPRPTAPVVRPNMSSNSREGIG